MLGLLAFLAGFFGSVIALGALACRVVDGAEYRLYRAEEQALDRPHGWFRFYADYRFDPDRRVRHDPFSLEHVLLKGAITLVPVALVLHFFF